MGVEFKVRYRQVVRLALVLCLFSAQAICAMPDIRVHGFLGKSAVLVINNKQRLLKQGETSPEGVTLVSTANSEAVLEVEGQRFTLGMSQHISSNFQAADVAEVRIPRGRNGHYFVTGYIDGHAMDFLVDTGASAVALNLNQAKALGLDYRNGESIKVSTASGVAEAREVTLNKLTIGNITMYNVRCIVHIGAHPRIALLGNSFLSHVQMSDIDGVLLLRKKF